MCICTVLYTAVLVGMKCRYRYYYLCCFSFVWWRWPVERTDGFLKNLTDWIKNILISKNLWLLKIKVVGLLCTSYTDSVWHVRYLVRYYLQYGILLIPVRTLLRWYWKFYLNDHAVSVIFNFDTGKNKIFLSCDLLLNILIINFP